jgi:hypothetical protein
MHGQANWLIDALEKVNGMPISQLYRKAISAPGEHRAPADPFSFGIALMAQSQGLGMGWEEDHPPFGLDVPPMDLVASFNRDPRHIRRRRKKPL